MLPFSEQLFALTISIFHAILIFNFASFFTLKKIFYIEES